MAQPHEKDIKKSHSNLYEIFQLFQVEQAAAEVTFQHFEVGEVCKPSRSSNVKGR